MNIFNQQVAIFKKIAILIVPVVVLWGCESTPDEKADTSADAVKVDSGATPSGMDQDAGATARPMTEAKKHPLDDPSSMLADRTIYFDFDKNDIKDEFRDVIKAHADFL
jgi:peptidoglycan-associated lipoprotein